ncbi:MAG: FAD-dependent oxidoreductase, partial [Bacillota bacterium]|nr:FAD-dependent oxidoreductase [Bacillota bacterium]
FLGKGVSYCATCDGLFFKDKSVAVVGGGNTALEEALYLSLICRKVYLIHRGIEFTGDKSLLARVRASASIHVFLNTAVTGLHGNRKLERIEISSCSGNKASAKGTTDGATEAIQANGLFVAIGRIPQNRAFAPVVALDERGYIIAGENCHTNVPGIFAAGDCRTKDLRQLVTATADGAVAAAEAGKFIS